MDWLAGVRPGAVTLYDPFFVANDDRQKNILIFELGKAVWFGKINPGPMEAPTERQQEFAGFLRRYGETIRAMAFAKLNTEDLSYLTDNDPQSQFAYAFRVAVLDLTAPATNPRPRSYSEREWREIQRNWDPARAEFERFLGDLFFK